MFAGILLLIPLGGVVFKIKIMLKIRVNFFDPVGDDIINNFSEVAQINFRNLRFGLAYILQQVHKIWIFFVKLILFRNRINLDLLFYLWFVF